MPAMYALATMVVLVAFFELWRAIFLIRQWDHAAGIPDFTLLKSLVVGLRFDLVIACYISVAFYVFSIIPRLEITRRVIVRRIHLTFLCVIAAVTFFIHMIDLEFFSFFNSRLNGMALTWRDTPDMVLSMVWEMYPVVWYFLLTTFILIWFVWVMRRIQVWLLEGRQEGPSWVHWIYFPLLIAVFFVGARGRLAYMSPIRSGVAYFSEYDFANQMALNPTFTFWRDAIYDARDKIRLEEMLATVQSSGGEPMVRQLLGMPDSLINCTDKKILREVRFTPPNDDPPNIILIVMESFGSTKLGALDNRFPFALSPCFDSLVDEGVLFTNFYSAGMHTYTGVFSTLTGYPHQFTELVMKQVPGSMHYNSLATILKSHDYQTLFFTTHDPHWDNMQGFAMSNGINRIYSKFDFDPDQWINMWGVPDHVLFDRAVEVFHEYNHERLFSMILTTSNHVPWQIPDIPFEHIPNDYDKSERLNAFKYSDWALGRFVRMIQNDPSISNTLIFITADNGSPYKPNLDMDLSYLQIPFLIIDTDKRLPAGKRIDRLGGQLDILATVMGRARLDYDNYSFGHDLLDSTTEVTDFAQFSEWFKVGYIEDNYYAIYRLHGEPGSCYRLDDLSVDLAKSEPELASQYLDKAAGVFRTAWENMSRPLHDESRFVDTTNF